MPPKKRTRAGARAASKNSRNSTASTPSNIPDSDSAMQDDETTTASVKSPPNASMTPSLASSKKGYKEPIKDEWTDEQDISLFKGIIRWKPVGMHQHFRMIALAGYLRNHGYDPEIETHTRPAGIRAHLEKYYDLDTLGQREDHIDEDPNDPLCIEFALPEEYDELKWEQGRRNKQASRNKGKEPRIENKKSRKSVETPDVEEYNTSPPRFNPSASPAPVTRKRKRGDTVTQTRGSTVEDTDDATSSRHSPVPAAAASTTRSVRSTKRATMSGSRHPSKDTTVDDDVSHIGDDDAHEEETDDTASVKATTRSNAKRAKASAPAKGAAAPRKSGRKK